MSSTPCYVVLCFSLLLPFIDLSLCCLEDDHAASLANARVGFVEEAKAKKELAAVEQERLWLEMELATTRTSRQEWKDKALAAVDEAKKNKAACDEVIVEIRKKYQKVKAHVLKNFRGALGELDFP